MAFNRKVFSRRGGYSKVTSSYRSGLEDSISAQLTAADVKFDYEAFKITYTIPAKDHTYTPDFLLPNNIIVESKGLFDSDDRAKHLLVKKQHPKLDIRFVFSNPKAKIYKGSKTTYADWCDKHGYKYASKLIPMSWLNEKSKSTEGLKPK